MDAYQRYALIFKAFCDENRLKILEVLQAGEQCACNLLDTLSISQSTLSHHMKILVESNLVEARKDGKWVYYGLSLEGAKEAVTILEHFTKRNTDYTVGRQC